MAGLMDRLAQAHGMSDEVWDRHANPLSGWTRMPILPLLVFSIWSRAWIGWWCLVPIALLAAFTWINPRLFDPPVSTDNWMSKAVMGERVWLAADDTPVPAHHLRAVRILNWIGALGLPVLVYGLWALSPGPVVFGTAWVLAFKLWFLDRMVWLFEDAVRAHPAYADWVR